MTDGKAIFPPPVTHLTSDYSTLKFQVKQAGLLEKQPRYYMRMLGLLVALLAFSVVMLLFVKPFWFQLLNAVSGYSYDAVRTPWSCRWAQTHISESPENDIVGLIAGNLCVG